MLQVSPTLVYITKHKIHCIFYCVDRRGIHWSRHGRQKSKVDVDTRFVWVENYDCVTSLHGIFVCWQCACHPLRAFWLPFEYTADNEMHPDIFLWSCWIDTCRFIPFFKQLMQCNAMWFNNMWCNCMNIYSVLPSMYVCDCLQGKL